MDEQTPTADWDGGWKEAVTGLLPSFTAMFFPRVYADIDWSRGYESLDKELQKIAGDSATGHRRVDLLFKVWLKSGQERWLLIHLEIQGQRDADFPERIFVYHHRIREMNGRPPVSFAVLADDDPSWKPKSYGYDQWGCRSFFRFPIVKLLDFADKTEQLEKNDNPFAVVVLAHLKARETADDRSRRRIWKVRLLKGLYNRGWESKNIRELLKIIDWFLLLPREDNRLVRQEIEADEKEKQMPYITSFEQIAVEDAEARGEARGRAEAIKEGQRYAVTLALRIKFGSASAGLASEIHQIDDLETLKSIAESIETAASLDDVRRIWSS